jgi:DNA-binding CsgD family transcriptional regulator
MKKAISRAEVWPSARHTTPSRPSPVYLVPTEPAPQFYLPKLDSVMRLAESAELGIIALDRLGSVIDMNLAARELIAAKDGLMLTGSEIEACSAPDTVALADAIRGVIDAQKAYSLSLPPVSMVRILRNRSSSLLVAVVPSGRPAANGASGDLAALLMISDPDRPLHESVRMLCELYRLTPGETRLTEHLIDGFTLAEIAEIMNLKPSTVRVYLKQIFAKTGVKRQAMLIRLFLTSRMPFNFPEAYSIVSRSSRASTMVPDRFNS